MSYCRFGWDNSDVYVFMNVGGYLECCGCILQEREWVPDETRPIFKGYFKSVGEKVQSTFHSTEEMVQHLNRHTEQGHLVPHYVIPGLRTDDAENFPKEIDE